MMEGNYDTQAIGLPAPFVNHTDMLLSPEHVRMTFSEKYAAMVPQYRAAVLMTRAEALALARGILAALEPPADIVVIDHRDAPEGFLLDETSSKH
jgi:hypothetical protein